MIKNHWKNFVSFTILLMTLFVFLSIFTNCNFNSSQPDDGPYPPEEEEDSSIKIYYALNESHSTSWVQQSSEGTIGIVYGVYNQGTGIQNQDETGNLIYKTILPGGSEKEELVTTARGVDKCVLLYDSDSNPHIFYASSDDAQQTIYHLYKKDGSGWMEEIVTNFFNEGGKFIYELSADIDTENAVHLLALKTFADPDSKDFMEAYQNSHLYYITNRSGNWEKTLIHKYDTFYTYDMAVKTQRRQDIAVDNEGSVHVVFGEQHKNDPLGDDTKGLLYYATNKSSKWVMEIALESDTTTDDAGWYPSLCLDKNGRPVVASTYLARVQTRSVRYAQLCYSIRLDNGEWQTNVVADKDDGYYGTDGRIYTGALPHLKIDLNNRPHIVFSDIASSHNPKNVLCTGQIRYAVYNGSSWDIFTIHRQSSPKSFHQGREMAGQCLIISNNGKQIQVVGQELVSTNENSYNYNLVHFVIK